jgi:hypothetical protein
LQDVAPGTAGAAGTFFQRTRINAMKTAFLLLLMAAITSLSAAADVPMRKRVFGRRSKS